MRALPARRPSSSACWWPRGSPTARASRPPPKSSSGSSSGARRCPTSKGPERWSVRKNVHPSLARISAFISGLGAGVALNDLDGDGLSNDVCRVESRTDQVIVAPVPGTGDRYAAFALDLQRCLHPRTDGAHGCVPGDFNEDGLPDLLTLYLGRTPVFFLRREGSALAATAFRAQPLVDPDRIWTQLVAVPADFDGDGHVDLMLGNYLKDGSDMFNSRGEGWVELPYLPGPGLQRRGRAGLSLDERQREGRNPRFRLPRTPTRCPRNAPRLGAGRGRLRPRRRPAAGGLRRARLRPRPAPAQRVATRTDPLPPRGREGRLHHSPEQGARPRLLQVDGRGLRGHERGRSGRHLRQQRDAPPRLATNAKRRSSIPATRPPLPVGRPPSSTAASRSVCPARAGPGRPGWPTSTTTASSKPCRPSASCGVPSTVGRRCRNWPWPTT